MKLPTKKHCHVRNENRSIGWKNVKVIDRQYFRWFGTQCLRTWDTRPSAETVSENSWKRFCLQRTNVYSTLEVLRQCAIQIHITLRYITIGLPPGIGQPRFNPQTTTKTDIVVVIARGSRQPDRRRRTSVRRTFAEADPMWRRVRSAFTRRGQCRRKSPYIGYYCACCSLQLQ